MVSSTARYPALLFALMVSGQAYAGDVSTAGVELPTAESLNSSLVSTTTPAYLMGTSSAADDNAVSDFFESWAKISAAARASQPHWIAPLATVTPLLVQQFRYDQYFEHTNTGADIDVYDAGKGLELISATTNEVLIQLPPYNERTIVKPANGWSDWPALTIKQRLISANEENGNYIVTAFFGFRPRPVKSRSQTMLGS